MICSSKCWNACKTVYTKFIFSFMNILDLFWYFAVSFSQYNCNEIVFFGTTHESLHVFIGWLLVVLRIFVIVWFIQVDYNKRFCRYNFGIEACTVHRWQCQPQSLSNQWQSRCKICSLPFCCKYFCLGLQYLTTNNMY